MYITIIKLHQRLRKMPKITPIKTGSIYCKEGVTLAKGYNPNKWISAPSISWLIETEDKKILVDTGMCNTTRANNHHYPGSIQKGDERIDLALRKLGIQPEQITHVIFTHLHWDHCQNHNLFKNAKFYVQEKELEFAMNPSPNYYRSYEQNNPIINPTFLNTKFELTNGDQEIIEGISVLFTPGHSPGHQAIIVKMRDERKIVIAGDAILHYANLIKDKNQNFLHPPGRLKDFETTIESIKKILSIADLVLPGHDQKVFEEKNYN